MSIRYLVFQPKQALLDVIATLYQEEYIDERFTTGDVWETEVHPHFSFEKWTHHRYAIEAKLAFLIHIMPLPQPKDKYLQLIYTLFGNPPHFSVENFDRWWTVTIMSGGSNLSRHWKEYISVEEIEKLEKTGDPDIDEWLDEVIRFKREERAKRTSDS